jgi:hypothetical protein
LKVEATWTATDQMPTAAVGSADGRVIYVLTWEDWLVPITARSLEPAGRPSRLGLNVRTFARSSDGTRIYAGASMLQPAGYERRV